MDQPAAASIRGAPPLLGGDRACIDFGARAGNERRQRRGFALGPHHMTPPAGALASATGSPTK